MNVQQVMSERDQLRERIVELESQLEDADLITQDALGHLRAAYEGMRDENVKLRSLLDEIAERHLLGQYDTWEGPGGRKESYDRIRALLDKTAP